MAVRATDWTPPPTVEQNNNVVASVSEDTADDTLDTDTPVHHSAQLFVGDDDDENPESYDERL